MRTASSPISSKRANCSLSSSMKFYDDPGRVRRFWREAQQVQDKRIWASLPSSLRIAWRHFLGLLKSDLENRPAHGQADGPAARKPRATNASHPDIVFHNRKRQALTVSRCGELYSVRLHSGDMAHIRDTAPANLPGLPYCEVRHAKWPQMRAPGRRGARRVKAQRSALHELVPGLAGLLSNPGFRTSRGIDGNCPRLPRLTHPCGGTPSAILHNPLADPPGHGHGRCGRLPVQSQYPERMPERGKKEPLRQRWRVHTCALIPPYMVYAEVRLSS
jgi:hypothetical protein